MMAANITGGRLGRHKERDPPHLRDFVTRVYLVRGDKKSLKLLERPGGFSAHRYLGHLVKGSAATLAS